MIVLMYSLKTQYCCTDNGCIVSMQFLITFTGTCYVRVVDANGLPASHYIIGQSYTLVCECSGIPDARQASYGWYKNDSSLSETGANITFATLQLSDAAKYTCNATASDMVSHFSGDPFTITVQSKLVHVDIDCNVQLSNS